MRKDWLLAQLDEDQKKAVVQPLCMMLCIANAGSGKTRVLTYRIAWWISEGVPESSFLMLTFTNKAAREMMERIGQLTGRAPGLEGGTFHSIASRFLRRYGEAVGVQPGFSILDEDGAVNMMNSCIAAYCDSQKIKKSEFCLSAGDLVTVWSYARNCMVSFETAADAVLEKACDEETLKKLKDKVIAAYESGKQTSGVLDFDDLLLKLNDLLAVPEVLRQIQALHPNVFVDEYQDINAVQDSIIHRLVSGEGCSLTAVGDDAQCIYSFRGSSVRFIQEFSSAYPGSVTMAIRYNYRSAPDIVSLAAEVINRSPDFQKAPKVMLPAVKNGYAPVMMNADDDRSQVDYIVSEIEALHDGGMPYSQMAILVRAGYLGRDIEASLTMAGIPVNLECGIRFFTRAHIRTCLCFLRFMANLRDREAFTSLCLTVPGIGPKNADRMFAQFVRNSYVLPYISVLPVPPRAREAYSSLVRVLLKAWDLTSPQEQLQLFISSYWQDKVEQMEDSWNRLQDLDILTDLAGSYETAREFLDEVVLNQEKEENLNDQVVISTVHRAKGLEWDAVFLPYMNDLVFPYKKCCELEETVEEERRLLYVAITRARKYLYLIRPYDGKFVPSDKWSRFIVPDAEVRVRPRRISSLLDDGCWADDDDDDGDDSFWLDDGGTEDWSGYADVPARNMAGFQGSGGDEVLTGYSSGLVALERLAHPERFV